MEHTLMVVLLSVGVTIVANVIVFAFFYGRWTRDVDRHGVDLVTHDEKLDELALAMVRIASTCQVHFSKNPDRAAAENMREIAEELLTKRKRKGAYG